MLQQGNSPFSRRCPFQFDTIESNDRETVWNKVRRGNQWPDRCGHVLSEHDEDLLRSALSSDFY